MVAPPADGRTYVCSYCHSKMLVAIDGHQIAQGMRLDFANIDNFLSQLANTLHTGFSERTKIHAQGTVVHAIEVDLEQDMYVAKREGLAVVAQHKKMVRGVALKTTILTLDKWVAHLSESLARHANSNARAAWVLAQLTGRGQ
jgi:hypothetical protein